jgi:hypothetical protein
MQAAVDAARAARGERPEPPENADPSTEPSPGMHTTPAEAVESSRGASESATDADAFAGTTAGPDDPASPDPGAPPDRDASQNRPAVPYGFGQPRVTLATAAEHGRAAGGKAAAGDGRAAGGKAAAGTAAGRGPRVAVAAALAVVITAAASVTAVLISRGSADRTDGTGQPGGQVARQAAVTRRAAAWVASQVSHDARVACDKVMCNALTGQGFPGRHLQLIRPGSADVVVVTPTVRRQLGAGLAAKWAPDALVSFGSGTAAITVRVIARQGAAAYQSALHADLKLRQVEGAGLLASGHVTASAKARKQLVSGLVDARLIVVLTALSAVHPIDIVAFGPPSAGASAGLPLRVADLAQTDQAAKLTRPDYLRFLLNVLHAQPAGYRPWSAGPARAAGGQPVFRIEFAAPSPLGLLGPQRP